MADAFRIRLVEGTAEPPEELLARHPDLQEFLEPLLEQTLAMMQHDNIAKVLDAGSTETGQPYFAMEHVPGLPITDYCDKNRLSTPERLELFRQVCAGVQHAHQKGIIHRDLKPSNILVSESQGKAVPKIIDFGIAKATDHRLTEATIFTATLRVRRPRPTPAPQARSPHIGRSGACSGWKRTYASARRSSLRSRGAWRASQTQRPNSRLRAGVSWITSTGSEPRSRVWKPCGKQPSSGSFLPASPPARVSRHSPFCRFRISPAGLLTDAMEILERIDRHIVLRR